MKRTIWIIKIKHWNFKKLKKAEMSHQQCLQSWQVKFWQQVTVNANIQIGYRPFILYQYHLSFLCQSLYGCCSYWNHADVIDNIRIPVPLKAGSALTNYFGNYKRNSDKQSLWSGTELCNCCSYHSWVLGFPIPQASLHIAGTIVYRLQEHPCILFGYLFASGKVVNGFI